MRIRFDLSIALWALAALVWLVTPARGVTVSIAPADTVVTVGESFTLRVLVDAVADLKGSETVHGYTAGPIVFQSAAAGDVFASGAYVDFVRPDVIAPPDSVHYDIARLVGSGAGPGVVAFFTFHAATEGDALVICHTTNLRNSLNQPIPTGCQGGIVHVIGPTAARGASWGRIKRLYR